MNKIFKTGFENRSIEITLILIRIVSAVPMLFQHGLGKLNKLTGDEPIKFADPIGLGEKTSLILAVFSEAICPIFLVFGFLTRLAAIPLIITMATIIFIVHIDDGFGKMELPLIYLVLYIILAWLGAGKYSVDYKIFSAGK